MNQNHGFLAENQQIQHFAEAGSWRLVPPNVTHHSNRMRHLELGLGNFDFHFLRHTHATELSEAGVNLKEIQRRLGHKSLEITNRRYIHATDVMEQQSIDIMNEMYWTGGVPRRGAVEMERFEGYHRL